MRFADDVLREDAWNPLAWVYLLGGGLFGLLSRDFAPLADRLASVAGRLEGIPARPGCRADDSRRRRASPGSRLVRWDASRPRPRSSSSRGVEELIRQALDEAASAAPATRASRPSSRDCGGGSGRAGGPRGVRDPPARAVLPASDGEGRLGRDLFARKMRHTMRSDA